MSCRPLSPTCKTKASGGQRPSKQWCFGPVCAPGHGGCADSRGDTRLARGLPCGSMPVVRPPPPMLEDIVRREDQERAQATRRAGGGQPQQRRARRVRAAQCEQLHLQAAGMAGGATEPGVAVPAARDAQPVQRCGACTAALYAWAAWRRQCQSETGVLESPGGLRDGAVGRARRAWRCCQAG